MNFTKERIFVLKPGSKCTFAFPFLDSTNQCRENQSQKRKLLIQLVKRKAKVHCERGIRTIPFIIYGADRFELPSPILENRVDRLI